MNIPQLKEAHDSRNDAYIQAKNDMFAKGQPQDDEWFSLAGNRLHDLSAALNGVTPEAIDEIPNYIEVVDCLVSFFDDVILECVLLTDKRREIEGQILDLCKHALGRPTEEQTRENVAEHIVCALIDGLIMTELPLATRATTVKSAMLHETNPLRLGQTFYDSFCMKYPEFADLQLLEYLRCEESLRMKLTNGDPAEVAQIAEKLMTMPINNPERFLLVSMVMFFNGMADEAVRILVLGLNDFPGNERLLKAQEGLAGVM